MMHTFYKNCSTSRRMRTAAHHSRAAQFRRTSLHTFYKKCAEANLDCGGVGVNTFYKKCAMGRCGTSHHHSSSIILHSKPMDSVNRIGSMFLCAILTRMRELGMNKSSLARKMNVSRAYVTKVLQGNEVNFSFATAIRFANALRMDFIPQLAIKSEEDLEEDTSSLQLQLSTSTLSPNLSTPAFAMA